MLSLFYYFILMSTMYYVIKILDFNRFLSYFMIGFIFTGTIQSLMIFLNFQDLYEFGFIGTRRSSYKPNMVDFEILLKSLITWFLYYLAMYLGFIIALRHKTIHSLQKQFIKKIFKIGVERYKIKLIYSLVFFLALKILIIFVSLFSDNNLLQTLTNLFKYVIPALIINLLLILPYVKSDRNKLKTIIFLFIFFTIISSIASGARGHVFLFILPIVFIFLIFYKHFISFKKFFVIFTFGIILFTISSIFKFLGKSAYTDKIDINQILSILESIGFNNFLTSLSSMTYARLNNMQTLYWFYYDQAKGYCTTFGNVDITFVSLLNNLIPSFIVDLSHFREINGIPIENWLFFQGTGGNPDGGWALPTIVESLWVTQNLFYALVVVTFLYYLIGAFFNVINRFMTPILPVLIILFFELFINPESILDIYYNIFRGIFFALIIQYLLMKKIKI